MRIREVLGPAESLCLLCGGTDVMVVRTRQVRRGFAKLVPGFDPHEHGYEWCRGCGAKNWESSPPDQRS